MEEEEKGFSLGAADYLVKPILEEDLVNSLNRLNGDGSINEVLVIDDDPNDLRLVEKILDEHSQFKPILAEGGMNGLGNAARETASSHHPRPVHARPGWLYNSREDAVHSQTSGYSGCCHQRRGS